MKKISKGVVLCLLVSAVFVMPISAVKNEINGVENSKETSMLNSGMFVQLPNDPGYGIMDFYGWWSSTLMDYQSYENFWGVAGPICGIHWWGFSMDYDEWDDLEPQGMTFTIAFYEDNNSMPGDIVFSYVDVAPSITKTEILYPEHPTKPLELLFFEYDLEPCCELSDGWVSIYQTGSDNGCLFVWIEPGDDYGDSLAYYQNTKNGRWTHFNDFSLVLTDGEETDLEIVDVQGGLGATLEIRNNGAETVDNYPVDFLVMAGDSLIIPYEIDAGETISNLGPGETITIDTGPFFGFGPFKIFVVGDGIDMHKSGLQLFIYTLVL